MQQEMGLYVISVSSYMKSSEWGRWLLCDLLKFLTSISFPEATPVKYASLFFGISQGWPRLFL
ncbi:MAG: hypothetical protein DRG35_02990 [Deltaproteobacteria bacterium]|nr:MAG: hypothetical protein DRG35_02990 [Deltaproteobacteria bacterium]